MNAYFHSYFTLAARFPVIGDKFDSKKLLHTPFVIRGRQSYGLTAAVARTPSRYEMEIDEGHELPPVGSFSTNEMTKSFIYHPTLNVILLITKDSNIRVLDLHSGQTLHLAAPSNNGKSFSFIVWFYLGK